MIIINHTPQSVPLSVGDSFVMSKKGSRSCRIHRHYKKCVKYIERNDLQRLKSHFSKRELDVNMVLNQDQDTLLHMACRMGHVAVIRFLLKKGAACLAMNSSGLLPLHLAVQYALADHPEAFSDIILPLIQKDPHSIDIPDSSGVTCRELLQRWKHSIARNLTVSDSESDTSSSSSESSHSDTDCSRTTEEIYHNNGTDFHESYERKPPEEADDNSTWSKRLADELEDEYMEGYGRYEHDYHTGSTEAETWDDWAQRMRREHNTKSQGFFVPRRASHKRVSSSESSRPGPKISREKRSRFDENLKVENAKISSELAEARNLIHKQNLAVYELLCDSLYGASGTTDKGDEDRLLTTASRRRASAIKSKIELLKNSSESLKYDDIPWPVATDNDVCAKNKINEANVMEFLFSSMTLGSEAYNTCLKKEQRRWHPDRFLQKCGTRLHDKQREAIIETVTTISQVLNKLSTKS